MGVEGIICKLADAPYRAGRSRVWLKVKCESREEFVAIGWTPADRQPRRHRRDLQPIHLPVPPVRLRTFSRICWPHV
jgi:bifunctional non-homologous end joining protein LigD